MYTPSAIADGVVAEAVFGADLGRAPAVCDPAVGAGAFLLAAARFMVARGLSPERIVGELLHGSDVDPLSVATTEAALMLWAWTAAGVVARPAPGRLVVGDPLLAGGELWAGRAPPGGFDVVVGNPPFQGQLSGPTVRTRQRAAELRARWGDAASGYVDSAALFLVLATSLARPGGRVALIVPESTLGSLHAGPARAAVSAGADLVGLWAAAGPVFDAGVKVCAPVFERRSPVEEREPPGASRPVRRTTGPTFSLMPDPPDAAAGSDVNGAPRWSLLLGAAFATPAVKLSDSAGVLGDLATATAGFRDQFYGLAPFVVEAPAEGTSAGGAPGDGLAPLITAGLIDPARCHWGDRTARFADRRWQRPAVDLAALDATDPKLARWVRARLRPKVLLATQTRVIEAAADPSGTAVPSVPVVSVEPFKPEDVWLVTAALLSPAASAWALEEAGGAALAVDAIKLSARQALALPLPVDRAAWHRAASLLHAAAGQFDALDWANFGAIMLAAHGLSPDDPLLAWWVARLPQRRRQPQVR